MPFVISTLTGDQEYTLWAPNPEGKGVPKVRKSVIVFGGANTAPQGLGLVKTGAILTPKGVATSVSKEELEFLEANKAFKRHKDRGYLTISNAKNINADEVAKDMTAKDAGAQLEDSDFPDDADKKPKVNGKNKK